MAELAVYGAWVNGALLPVQKKKDERKALQKIEVYGLDVGANSFAHGNKSGRINSPLQASSKTVFDALKAQAAGNLLCRELTVLPPNELTPGMYRQRVKKLARANGWKHEEFTMPKLRKIGRAHV